MNKDNKVGSRKLKLQLSELLPYQFWEMKFGHLSWLRSDCGFSFNKPPLNSSVPYLFSSLSVTIQMHSEIGELTDGRDSIEDEGSCHREWLVGRMDR